MSRAPLVEGTGAATAQVVPWLLPGDALSNDALAIAAQLAPRGQTTLHCRGPVHPGLQSLVTAGDPPARARVLVHIDEREADTGHVEGASVVARVHALAPPRPERIRFERYDAVLAGSSWTGSRAADRGADHVAVVPPFLPLDAFLDAYTDLGSHADAVVVVGPFRRDSALPDAVLVDHELRAHFAPQVRLCAIGRATEEPMVRVVSALCDELRLGSPWAGHLGHGDYVHAIGSGAVVLHVGGPSAFGSALVEAMAIGTPVVARAGGAVAETLGGAGILLPADADPFLIAEAVWAVVSDSALRDRLRTAGRGRAQQLAPAASAVLLDQALASVGWW